MLRQSHPEKRTKSQQTVVSKPYRTPNAVNVILLQTTCHARNL